MIKRRNLNAKGRVVEAEVFEVTIAHTKKNENYNSAESNVRYKISVNIPNELNEFNIFDLSSLFTIKEAQKISKKGKVKVIIWKNLCELREVFTNEDTIKDDEDYIKKYYKKDLYSQSK